MNAAALRLWFLSLAALFAASCTSLRLQPDQRELAADAVPEHFAEGLPTVTPGVRWWEDFGSAELNHLMDLAFQGNLDVAQAWARVRQAEFQAVQANADGRIQATGSASADATRVRGDSSKSFGLGLALSYEVDLWGRIRASANAAELAAQASEQDVQGTALALSGTLAQTWLDYRTALARIAVVENQIDTGQKQLELLQMQQRQSISDAVDVLQQRQQIASLASSLPPLRESQAALELQLRLLLGLPPYAPLDLAAEELPAMPEALALGLPSRLLEQRPDIRAAWFRLRAQEWTVTQTEAARLPTFDLTGSGSYGADRLENLFDNWALNLAGGLAAPLLDGGRRKAASEQAAALADERFLAYRQTVLAALHEVADALAREHWRRVYLERLEEELRLATETLQETQRRYRSGLSDYLPVLTALASQQKTELALVGARADLLGNRIDLCRAIGGQLLPTDLETTTTNSGDGK
jgi:NodT family efflux transporter outer membrane factor (OMF) lipoprotein